MPRLGAWVRLGFGDRRGLLHLPIFLVPRGLSLGCAWGARVLGRDGPIREEIVVKSDLRFREMGVVSIVTETLRDSLDTRILESEGPGIGIDPNDFVDRSVQVDVGIDVGIGVGWDACRRVG